MLRPHYCDLQRGKLLELKPHSFAQLLKYMDAGGSTEPERLSETFGSLRAGQQAHDDDVQDRGTSDLASVLQLILVGYLVIVVIYTISAYLQSLFSKALRCVVQFAAEFSGFQPLLRWLEG